jgi:hypothetical protein
MEKGLRGRDDRKERGTKCNYSMDGSGRIFEDQREGERSVRYVEALLFPQGCADFILCMISILIKPAIQRTDI